MTHHAGFLQDIIEHPEEDALRLIYADWLEDNGDPDRARFIRVSIERGHDNAQGEFRRVNDRHSAPGKEWQAWGLPAGWRVTCYRRLHEVRGDLLRERRTLAPGTALLVRGFVAEVTLPCAEWMRHGPALVRAAPLERVGLADRKPLRHDGWFFWLRHPGVTFADDLPYLLPDGLAYVMSAAERREGWESEAAAREALSVACLQWARKPVAATH
jgi:uncharacterized protein (TIGR02996 family)